MKNILCREFCIQNHTILKHIIRMMKLQFVLLFMCCAGLYATDAHSQEMKITVVAANSTVKEILREIEEKTDCFFLYNKDEVDVNRRMSVQAEDRKVLDILSQVFAGTDIACIREGSNIVLVKNILQQTTLRRITGRVLDEKGEPVIGANVVEKGTANGTITDIDGNFSLNISEDAVLQVSYIGYLTKEAPAGGRSNMDITILEDTQRLEEVVIVGYGTQKRINLTGAVDMVTEEVFNNRSVSNVTQGLQGAVPNLNLKMLDGKPTQSPAYNIRGNTSIGQKGDALVLIDGVEGDPSMLNPNDIASISVLKDAASAAIYGARGVFGVVLITTKNPARDRTTVTYNGSFSVKSPTTVPDIVTDGYTYARYFNESWTAWNDYSQTPQNINKTLRFSQEYLAELQRRQGQPGLPDVEVDESNNYVYYGSTDWYGELYKTSKLATDHNLSATGSAGRLDYYVTGRYYGEEGLFRYNSDDYNMYNFRAKGSIQLFDWMRINNNTEYSVMNYHNPMNVGESGGIWRNLADEGHPPSTMFNPDGTLTHSAAYTVGDFWYGRNGMDTDRRVFKNTASFTASFLENQFRVNGDFTYQSRDDDETRIRVPVPFSRKPGVIEYVGSSTNDIRKINRTTSYIAANLYTEYEKTFALAHYFKGMIGYNYEQSAYSQVLVQRNGLLFEDAKDLNMAAGQSFTTEGGYERWKISGGFFRANYAFKDRYLLEVNGRLDGSSKFPSDEQYGFFPSVSGGWRVSEESFWKPGDLFTDLKLRASYGSLGNGNIDPYTYLELFAVSRSGRVLNDIRPQQTGVPAVIPSGLTWETATTFDAGLDFGMLSNRLRFSGDYYVTKTTDMFTVGMSLPDVFGAEVPKGNFADMTTKGFELSLTWRDRFRLAGKPFAYDVRFTLSDYQSVIDKYNNPEKKLGDDIYYEGQKLGEIWGYETEGFFTSEEDIAGHARQTVIRASNTTTWLPGDIKFKDQNNDGVIDYGKNTVDDPGDKIIIGNTTPRFQYSFSLGGEWNNFFLSAFFRGVGKQDWYPSSEAGTFWGQYNRPYNNVPAFHIGNIWSEDNPDAYFPRYRGYVARESNGELRQAQTRYLQNVAYIRLQNLQAGYNLPRSFVAKMKMQQVRVFLSGENLWSWSPLYKLTKDLDVAGINGSDQDLHKGSNYGDGWNYPLLKSISFGLSVTF
jgi:TonB-linked SusC/RagA family outer membrane protein